MIDKWSQLREFVVGRMPFQGLDPSTQGDTRKAFALVLEEMDRLDADQEAYYAQIEARFHDVLKVYDRLYDSLKGETSA